MFDRCLSVHLARMIAGYEARHTVRYLDDYYPKTTADVDWITDPSQQIPAILDKLDTVSTLCCRRHYSKEVDAQEATLRFWQEIYDDQGTWVQTHEKFPVDKGHQKI